MTNPRDPYWDELGVAWRPADTDTSAVISKLKSRMRRQSLTIMAGLWLGLPATAAGFLIGAMTLWTAWTTGTWNFLTRGSAILIISILAARGVWLLLTFRSIGNEKPPGDTLTLAVASSQHTLAIIRLALAGCIIAAVFGLFGTAVRYSTGSPPALSPVIDMGVLAIFAIALTLWFRQVKVSLSKLQYLAGAIASEEADRQ